MHSISGAVVIDVEDEGLGIDPFDRARHAPDRRGIGLAVARSLTEAEGGRL